MKQFLIALVLANLFLIGFGQNPAGCNFATVDGLYTCDLINGNIDADKQDDPIIGVHKPINKTNDEVQKVVANSAITGYILIPAFRTFTNIEIIEFTSGNIAALNSSFFFNCEKLKSFLVTGSTQLLTIEAKTFSACTALENIVLKSNHIAAVQGDAFEKLISLTTLDLSENDIVNPAPTAFRNLAELKVIHLDRNQMVTLSDRLFETNAKLEQITLSENRVEVLSKALVAKVTELKILDMSKNKINKTERGFFDKFTQLEKLYFSENVCIAKDYETVDIVTVKEEFETCFKNNDATNIIIYSKFVLLFVAISMKFL